MSNQATITTFLRQQLGLSPAQVAGVEGNFAVESQMFPTASNPREGAIGIAQWEGGRRTALQALARARGTSETDLDTQLDFLKQELNGPEAGAFAALKASQTPEEAAQAFDRYYERSSTASLPARIADAQKIAGGADLGNPSGTVSNAPTDSTGLGGVLSGLSSGITGQIFKITLYGVAAAAAAGLVIVGAVHTVSDK